MKSGVSTRSILTQGYLHSTAESLDPLLQDAFLVVPDHYANVHPFGEGDGWSCGCGVRSGCPKDDDTAADMGIGVNPADEGPNGLGPGAGAVRGVCGRSAPAEGVERPDCWCWSWGWKPGEGIAPRDRDMPLLRLMLRGMPPA